LKKKRDQGREQANVARGNSAEKEEITDIVLTTIDKEEVSKLMCKPCNNRAKEIA
jgi:hypothetical protein